MVIELKPDQQRVIDLAVQSGAYQDPSEVVDQAFEIIREQLDLGGWMLESVKRSRHSSRRALLKPNAAS